MFPLLSYRINTHRSSFNYSMFKIVLLHKRITWPLTGAISSITWSRHIAIPATKIVRHPFIPTFSTFALLYSTYIPPITRTTSRLSTLSTGYCTRTPGLPLTPDVITFCKLYNNDLFHLCVINTVSIAHYILQ